MSHIQGHIGVITTAIYGCTDPNAINYDPLATHNDGTCNYSRGCTDPNATNFNQSATLDDGSCEYPDVTPIYNEGITVSFSEASKGWTSFKSFVQDSGLSLNNDYYTFKNTNAFNVNGGITSTDFLMWKHHFKITDPVTGLETNRNNFYNQQYDSRVDVLFNEESATVKSFASMKYEGTQSKITEDLTDPAYFNNEEKKGWYVESGITDLQSAGEMEFKDKEGKWFSYMKGVSVEAVKDLNSKEFSFQGIGILDSVVTTGNVYGCTDPAATNWDITATDDDGSCVYPLYSCWQCDGNGDCVEDTNFLNGPCNGYTDKIECEDLTNYCTGPPPSLHTLTINDVTLSVQQINYSVSTFTKAGIPGDSVIPPYGTGAFLNSEYRLEISADAGYTVQASDFAIEFPSGTAVNSIYSWTPFIFIDDYGHWSGGVQVPPANGIGQGNDLGTGPLVASVVFQDSENPTNDNSWAGPTGSNKVLVDCLIATDMQDNIPGDPNWAYLPPGATDVYMTDNGMQSTNSINPGTPGDLDIGINIIGSAQSYSLGCTDPLASNYDASATVDDGSCVYCIYGCMDVMASNYTGFENNATSGSLITCSDSSCTYSCGCTDDTSGINNSTIFSNRPVGYYGPAENVDPNAAILCDDACTTAPCVSGQTGTGCCCVYDDCNVNLQSLEGSIDIIDSDSVSLSNGSATITLNAGSNWLPLNSVISISVYDSGSAATHVPGLKSIFWSPSNAAGWTSSGVSSSGGGGSFGVYQNDSSLDPVGWNVIPDMPPGDYHVSIDTGDCVIWYDFTILDLSAGAIYGCMDSTACNYNPLATIDDGSCDFSCYGCTDSVAYGYNALSTMDDCSCCYDLDITFNITADSGGGGDVANANGIIEIDIPTSIAAGGLPRYDCQGTEYHMKYTLEYHHSPGGSNYSNFNVTCGSVTYGNNDTVGDISWTAAANSGNGGWTKGNNTSGVIMPTGGCGGGNWGAMGGYRASSLVNPPNCVEGSSHAGTFSSFPTHSANGPHIASGNYKLTLSYKRSGNQSFPHHVANWCTRYYHIFVPCGTGTTTTTVTGVCNACT